MNTAINTLLSVTIASTVGAAVMINGSLLKVDDLKASAREAVNLLSREQLTVSLELYYLDQGVYPEVYSGGDLIDVLKNDGYIYGRPLDPNVFLYEPGENGQSYKLTIKDS